MSKIKVPKRGSRVRRKKKILIAEIVILLLLTAAAFGSGWLKRKLNLVNHQKTDDLKLITAEEANSNFIKADLKGKDMVALVGVDTRETNDAANSDTMIIALINHDDKTIKLVSLYRDTYLNVGNDRYDKANSAYNTGGPEAMLTMMNLNLDLNLTQYASVNFKAVTDVIQILGGIDIKLSRAEMQNINKINSETARVTGYPYHPLNVPSEQELPEGQYRTVHLDPPQGLTYARIRYTAGNDFRRTARQRMLIQRLMEETRKASGSDQNKILEKVLPQVTTNISNRKMLSMVKPLLSYKIEKQVGFPFEHYEDDASKTNRTCVVPVTLEQNVKELHELLFPDSEYKVSETVHKYSSHISEKTGLTEKDIPKNSEDGQLPWNQDESAEISAAASSAGS